MYFSREAMDDSVKEAIAGSGQLISPEETVVEAVEEPTIENDADQKEEPVAGGKFIFNLNIDSEE